MEFRRVETRRILRYREFITDAPETKKILEQLQKQGLEFSVKLRDMGGKLSRCTVTALGDACVTLFSNSPSKVKTTPALEEIEELEVECNCDFIAEENDDGGRWSRLM